MIWYDIISYLFIYFIYFKFWEETIFHRPRRFSKHEDAINNAISQSWWFIPDDFKGSNHHVASLWQKSWATQFLVDFTPSGFANGGNDVECIPSIPSIIQYHWCTIRALRGMGMMVDIWIHPIPWLHPIWARRARHTTAVKWRNLELQTGAHNQRHQLSRIQRIQWRLWKIEQKMVLSHGKPQAE